MGGGRHVRHTFCCVSCHAACSMLVRPETGPASHSLVIPGAAPPPLPAASVADDNPIPTDARRRKPTPGGRWGMAGDPGGGGSRGGRSDGGFDGAGRPDWIGRYVCSSCERGIAAVACVKLLPGGVPSRPVPPRSTCLQHCGVITFTLGRADPVSAQNPHRCTSSRISSTLHANYTPV